MKNFNDLSDMKLDLNNPPMEIFNAYRHAIFIKREEKDTLLGINDEEKLLACVKNGNVNGLKEQISLLQPPHTVGTLSKNELRQLKYLFVAAITLVTREAIHGGLGETEAFSLSDVYIQYMDNLDSSEDILGLIFVALFDFTEKVQNLNKSAYSPIIRKCNNYISKNLHSKITIDDLAKECGYTKAYISLIFKKELNMTAMDFVMSKKIEVAKDLLATSNYSIQTVALSLGFATHSNFSSVFCKSAGMSPREYRNLNNNRYIKST